MKVEALKVEALKVEEAFDVITEIPDGVKTARGGGAGMGSICMTASNQINYFVGNELYYVHHDKSA